MSVHQQLNSIVSAFNQAFGVSENCRLIGGAAEPIYLPPCAYRSAEIHYREDFVRSALHEVAHWCLASYKRRQLTDYGYWYAPDGRNRQQQELFFQVEVIPQALECLFCQTVNIAFLVSGDNLDGEETLLHNFAAAVENQVASYQKSKRLPPRAATFLLALSQ